METLHSLTPEAEWFVWNYKDQIPEPAHKIQYFPQDNLYGTICDGPAYESKGAMLRNYIAKRPFDTKCETCLRGYRR